MQAHDILPDHASEVQIAGTTIRKGTVGALLANAATLRQPGVSDAQGQRAFGGIPYIGVRRFDSGCLY